MNDSPFEDTNIVEFANLKGNSDWKPPGGYHEFENSGGKSMDILQET